MSFFELSRTGHVATVALNRPEKANALDLNAWHELGQLFTTLDAEDGVHVVLLIGNGRHFCAGMDLAVFEKLHPLDRAGKEHHILEIQRSITAIEECGKPVVALIDGGCIGGGVDLITACDLRYCTDAAYFTVKEVDLGIVADIGTLQRLPKIVSPGIAAELAFTGRKVYGPEATRIGLCNASFPTSKEARTQVDRVMELIAGKDPRVLKGIKESLRFTRDHTVAEALTHVANLSAGLLS